ncbi:Retinol dehydrogenase 12 [Mycena venus]|uniref:Retinol dehydrogenase 12 n=1 Tax=Mycena venus TaxID=2733690 RepID=A0A8H6XQT1_9AGAR|nr:Retinol dehydrogenase 12 [Mycena venus]
MDATIGAIEIGTVLSGVLFGLITSQTYVYFKTFPGDSRFSKVLVGMLWVVELIHTACISNALYMYTVKGYGDPTFLIRFPLSLDATIILHGATVIIGTYKVISAATLLTCTLVQLFFTHRITKFVQKTYYLSAIAIFILFVRFAAFVVSGVAATRMSALLDFMSSWKPLILFDLISCAITDVMMSAILVYQLAQRRSHGYQSTLALMDKLIMWSVETCLVTTFTTIVMMICFLTMGEKNFVWIGILLVQPKIFSNALLANLNSRSGLRNAASTNVHEMTPSRVRWTPGSGVTMSKQSERFDDKFQASPVQDSFSWHRESSRRQV